MLHPRLKNSLLITLSLVAVMSFAVSAAAQDPAAAGLSVDDYGSIQEAIDKNPGKMIYVPAGKYEISKAIDIATNDTGLFGYGEIIQTNPQARFLQTSKTANVRIKGLTLRRPEGKMETEKGTQAIYAVRCSGLVIDEVQIFDNRTSGHVIRLEYCSNSQIRNCLVENYMQLGLQSRMKNPDWGYSFNVIVGSGITVRSSNGVLVQGNRIIERNLVPTLEIKKKHKLGDFVEWLPEKGRLLPQKMWDQKYNNAWHQGSAIECRFDEDPRDGLSDYTQILGNYIQNAAQGIDIHGDYVIVANNIINDCFLGAKTMHGSKNVIVTGNQFSKCSLWGFYVAPGSFSYAAREARGDKPANEANVQRGTIIANNIFSDIGYGSTAWAWKDDDVAGGPHGIRLGTGQQKDDMFPASDIIIQGNVVYDPGRDGVVAEDGKVKIEPPHYKNAVHVDTEPGGPQNVRFENNIFHPGVEGVSNIEIKP